MSEFRAVLPLLKARVTDINQDEGTFKIAIGGSTTVTVRVGDKMSFFDIRDGDLLTLYTEVLTKKAATNA